MAPSTSSFFDLKAQLSKQEAEFAQIRALGKETAIRGGVKRPDKVCESFHTEIIHLKFGLVETHHMGPTK